MGVQGQTLVEDRTGARAGQGKLREGRKKGTYGKVRACWRAGQDRERPEIRSENSGRAGAELRAG